MHRANPRHRSVPARIEVYIQPRASRTEAAGLHAGIPKIRVAAPAVENAANRALVEFVAERLGVAKSRVRIVSGAGGRRKVLQVDGVGADELRAAIATAR